jgi:hypothetical protein
MLRRSVRFRVTAKIGIGLMGARSVPAEQSMALVLFLSLRNNWSDEKEESG